MRYEIYDDYTFVKDGFLPFALTKKLSFQVKSLYSNKLGSVYSQKHNCFFTGVFPYVYKACPAQVIDRRKTPIDKTRVKTPEWLRPHQKIAFEKMLYTERGIIHHTTAAGKTFLASAWASAVPCKHLFIVHRQEILFQFYERFSESLEEDFDLLWKLERKPKGSRVALGMIQSILSQVESGLVDLSQYDSIVVDESHHAGWRSQYFKLLFKSKAFFRFGLTGTPRRDSGDSIVTLGLFGPILHRYVYKDAVEDGFVVPVKVQMINNKEYSGSSKRSYPYHPFYSSYVVDNSTRNNLICKIAVDLIKKNKSVLIMVNEVNHSTLLSASIAKMLLEKGFSEQEVNEWVSFVNGKDEKRDLKKFGFENKFIRCLVATTIYDEGVDIHCIDAVILAGGGKSERVLIQRVGRGQRLDEEKHELIVYDFMDLFHHKSREHAQRRLAVYKAQGYAIELKEVIPYENFETI